MIPVCFMWRIVFVAAKIPLQLCTVTSQSNARAEDIFLRIVVQQLQ